MQHERASEYRLKSDECRTRARLMIDTDVRAQWIMLAEQWQVLADSVEMNLAPADVSKVQRGQSEEMT